MEYFGTSLTEAGHYRWNIDNGWQRMNYRFEELPFHPENITNNLPKGSVVFYQGGEFTVIGIAGSCKDGRPGTKSIFWVREVITKGEMIERIKSNPVAMEIINAMSFRVIFPVFVPVPVPEIQMPGERPKVICLCGSMRFIKEFHEQEERLSLQRVIVLKPGVNTKDAQRTDNLKVYKPMLDELHLRKIDLSDEVFVINKDGYIGESTRNEINYALKTGKPVNYMVP